MAKKKKEVDGLNEAQCDNNVVPTKPYRAVIRVKGVADLLFHRWDCQAIEDKGGAKKGSKEKKTDNLESYVYRIPGNGHIGVPGENFRQSVILAAKYMRDPRSPRKSAMDLFKAGVVDCTGVAPFLDKPRKEWDYLDRRRAVVQRNGITRVRPAILAGWEVEFVLQVLSPEYITPSILNDAVVDAGRLVGLCDFRPTFGRFQLVSFKVE